jgi:hypothetical protein
MTTAAEQLVAAPLADPSTDQARIVERCLLRMRAIGARLPHDHLIEWRRGPAGTTVAIVDGRRVVLNADLPVAHVERAIRWALMRLHETSLGESRRPEADA